MTNILRNFTIAILELPAKLRAVVVTAALAVVVVLAVPAAFPGSAPLGLLLQGAEFGAINGLLALGLVLIYRATRIINFSYGAMGSLAATIGVELYLGHKLNWYVCVAIALVAGGVLGGAVSALIRWRWFTAPRLILLVASIGLAQLFGGLQFLLPSWIKGPSIVGAFATPLSSHTVNIRPVLFDGDDLLVVIVIPVVLAALSWFLLKSNAGVAVRSVADNSDRAQLLGIPVKRLTTLVWVISGVLAALAVMISTPGQGLTITAGAGPAVILPALAAAVIAGMENMPLAFGAGVGLGIISQVVQFNTGQQAAATVVFLGVIVVALLFQRRGSSRAAEAEDSWIATGVLKPIPAVLRKLPEVRIARATMALAIGAVLILVPLVTGPGTTFEYTVAIIYGMLAISLVVLSGWSGSISLGQMGLAGAGGVVAGDLIQKANLDFFLCLAAAGAAGAVLALIVGIPALRIRGTFLAVTTFALAITINEFFLNPTIFSNLTPQNFVRPVLWGRFDLISNKAFYFLCLGLLALTALFVKGLRQARAGRVLLATRDNPKAAAAMSVPNTRTRLVSFVLSGVIAGVAGALYATALGSVGLDTFDPSLSLLVFIMAVIGGLGSISGALIGVALVEISNNWFPKYEALLSGIGLLVTLVLNPGGIGAGLNVTRDKILRKIALARHLHVPSLVADRRIEDDGDHAPHEEALLVAALSGPVRSNGPTNGSSNGVNNGNGNGHRDDATLTPIGVVPLIEPKGQPSGAVNEMPIYTDITGAPIVLSCRGIEISYGPVQVLFGVDLDVREGEIVALLGTNGAGKSTLLKGVSGLVRISDGSVRLTGRSITRQPADMTARQGIALMPGGRGIFPTLTVEENLRLGAWMVRKDRSAVTAARQRMLELFPVLERRLHQQAANLSGGEQQMLSLAMALMVRPKVLMIDELSLGLAPTIVAQLLDVVRTLNAEGITIVVVEQSVNVALELAERAVFMEKGEVRFSGPTQELLDRPDILRSVFIEGASAITKVTEPAGITSITHGADHTRLAPEPDAPIVLECRGITKQFGGIAANSEVDLVLREGQILGLIGHNGAGKTTLMDCISGFLPIDSGSITLGGMDITHWPSHVRATTGLGRTFQEAKLFPSLTVAETISVALERHLASRDLIAAGLRLPASLDSEAEVASRVDELIAAMRLDAFKEKLTGELSTGTRRIVELACVLAQDPAVLLLDEPSGGVAQRETEAMGPLLERVQTVSGCSIIVIEHDMPLLTAICDEMIALELGEVIAVGTPQEVLDHPRVIESYLGTDDSTINRSGARVPT